MRTTPPVETARWLCWPALCLITLAARGAPGPEAPAEWRAGTAAAVITPRTNMWMAGYAARKKPSEGTAQDLFAKALALEDGAGGRLVIVTMDLIGVLPAVRQSVEKRVASRYGLPPQGLLLNASHTHSGPEYRPATGREREAQDYAAFLDERLVGIVGEALGRLKPARLFHARARCGFAMNRRRNYALPPDDPNAKKAPNPDGPVDHDVPVLMVQGADTNLCAVLFGYACHNTTVNAVSMAGGVPRHEFNGDYAGCAQEALESARPGLTAMFLNGCGADQNPYPRQFMLPYASPLELARQHGRTLAMSVEAAMAAHQRPVRGPLRSALELVSLDRRPPSPGKGRTPVQPPPPRLYPVQVIRFGDDVTLVALGSEVVVDYALRLKRELAGPAAVWVAGYSNDYPGYIPSRRVLQEGGYEAPDYAPGIEDAIVSRVRALHERLGR